MTDPQPLTDDDLIAGIAVLAGTERTATATLIWHLAELESRNLHIAQGFRSLFGYCRHAARRFPVILPMLAEGRLHLTAVRLLAPRLRDEDHLALLGGAIHKSRREIVALLARWFPSPDVPSSIRKLPTSAASATTARLAVTVPGAEAIGVSAERTPGSPEEAKGLTAGSITAPRPVPAAHRPVVTPLSPARYRLQVTIQEDAHHDLRCLQNLMSREIPDGDPALIVARALKRLRQEAERKAFAATTRPREARASKPGSRDIPAHVERAVWQRDGGQCAFEGAKARCSERSFLEFHHVRPWVVGGPATAENIALRCSAHNAYEAAVYFGPIRAAMAGRDGESFRNETQGSRREPTGPAP